MSYRPHHQHHHPRRDLSADPHGGRYEYPSTYQAHRAGLPPQPANAAKPGKPPAKVPTKPAAAHPRPAAKTAPRRHANASDDYTLAHAGRQIRVGPVAFWIVVGTLVIMAGWTLATGTYFAFHDDVLKRLIARQAEMQYAYEDRIAELRGQLDRVSSRQLLDQEQFEQKLDQIARRQAALESRASALATLPDLSPTGSVRPRGTEPARTTPLKPSPIGDGASLRAPARDTRAGATRPTKARGGVEGFLARMQDSLDRVEHRQFAALSTLEENYETRNRRMRGVLGDLGLAPGKSAPPPATGGPFVPASAADVFERQMHRVTLARTQGERLTRTLAAVPVRKPVDGEMDFSSGFGMRVDPFLRSPAMHTGLDFRGDTGDPVRATATGTVSFAGTNGGYGKMVEIDHGNGLSTRYAHLSAVEAKVGQTVRIGQIVGRLGSTGRSTGPHLHYETRVDGDPVDPQKYLRAGAKLGAL